jgi:predicted phosphohydrolase
MEKTMEVFGKDWEDYLEKIEKNWQREVKKEDLVLIPGDLSWGKNLEEALIDLKWLDSLNGEKLIIKGNHDYWWPSSYRKLQKNLPPSFHSIQNNTFNWKNISIGGARLWDSSEYNFDEYIRFQENPYVSKKKPVDNEKIFQRELKRLHLSLKNIRKEASLKIAMTHFPPISANLKDSRVSKILEHYKIDLVVFGHLHHVKRDKKLFGVKNNIKYLLTSADYLEFKPLKIL